MTTTMNIRDFPRGTNPPITFNMTNPDGSPFSLAKASGELGCVVAMVIREEPWEDSDNDDTALIRRRVGFWNVDTQDDFFLINNPQIGDLCWVNFPAPDALDGSVFLFDGLSWNFGETDENRILDGMFTLRFTREETLLPIGRYYHSVDIMFPNGEVSKVMRGTINITSNTINEI